MNLWKDIKTGPLVPKVVYAVIEVPRGSRNKYEYDKEKEVFLLNRVLPSPFHYPADYGIIPQTMGDDGNPLDILVITDQPTFPGCVIECRPIGVMKIKDEGEKDDKIISIPINDPRFRNINNIQDIYPAYLKEIAHFFMEYKKLEGKTTEILRWKNAQKAFESIEHSKELYNEMTSIKSLFLIK